MCLASLSEYDAETVRLMLELEAMLVARRKRELAIDEGIRARANRFMPAAGVDVSALPATEAPVAGTHQEKAA